MNYTELSIKITPYSEEISGILIAELSDLNYESFSETDDTLFAYVQEKMFSQSVLATVLKIDRFEGTNISYSVINIPDQNWNKVWESNFEPVIIGEQLLIRAPFHKIEGDFKFTIEIEPKMSFGTGHHETTSLMSEQILDMDLSGKKVLDMGSGTGILAILAHLKGAIDITAIDIDEWAYKNSLENFQKNNCNNIKVLQGDTSIIPNESYDIIFANINLNVLLKDISIYSPKIRKPGFLLVSGFYIKELPLIEEICSQSGLKLIDTRIKNNWCCSKFGF